MGRFGCSVCCITDGWALGSSYGGGQPGYGGGGYGYGPCLRCTQGFLAVERVHCSTEPPPPWSRVRFWAVLTHPTPSPYDSYGGSGGGGYDAYGSGSGGYGGSGGGGYGGAGG